jgi:predicted phage terminase large subunit-like protein
VFLKVDYKVTQPVVYSKIREHKLQRVIFEANNGGDFYGRDIEEMLNKDHKGFVYVGNRTAPGKMGKMARIEQHSPVIKKFVFLAEICYNDTMYKDAIKNLTSYSRTTQNKNDDAPDSLAGLAAMMRQNLVSTIQVIPRDLI